MFRQEGWEGEAGCVVYMEWLDEKGWDGSLGPHRMYQVSCSMAEALPLELCLNPETALLRQHLMLLIGVQFQQSTEAM